MTPVARTLRSLRAAGHEAEVVERWIRRAKPDAKTGAPGVRRDLFGCFDVISIKPQAYGNGDLRIVGIQCCAMSGRAAHLHKLRTEPRLGKWWGAGGLCELWAWRKVKVKPGGKAVRWRCEVVTVRGGDGARW